MPTGPSMVTELTQVLMLQGTKQSEAVAMLIEQYKNDKAVELALKQCLKAWKIEFAGASEIPPLATQHDPSLPPTLFGKYFNHNNYPKVFALCNLAYQFEKNGIPTEHATKLCVIFSDEKKILEYLGEYAKSVAAVSKTPLHDACLFALPDFKEKGFLDDGTGCQFAEFQAKAAQGVGANNWMLRRDFKILLPFAWNIQKVIEEKNKQAKASGYKPVQAKIDLVTNELNTHIKRLEQLERKKSALNDDEEDEYAQLSSKISKQLCQLADLSAGKSVTLLELKAFYEVFKVNTMGSYKLFIDHGIPGKFHEKFKTLDRSKAGKLIPDIKIDGATLNYPGYYLMKVPVEDELQAARAACFGKITGCCQSLSGEAGEPCVIHGLTSPHGGFYVLCKGDSNDPKVTDPVIAQSWVWRSQSGAIVFDSVEVAKNENENKPLIKSIIDFYHALTKKLITSQHTTKVACGATSGISHQIGISNFFTKKEQFVDYNAYCDSIEQRLLHDTAYPYVGVQFTESKELTQELIDNAATRKGPLGNSIRFIEMLSWALSKDREDLLEQIDATFRDEGKIEKLNKIFPILTEYNSIFFNEDFQSAQALESLLDSFNSENIHIDTLGPNGMTLLMLAAQNGHTDVCLKLLNKKANIHTKNINGESAAMLAAKNGHTSTCMKLIERSADIKTTDNNQDVIDALIIAMRNGHQDLCLKLIDKSANLSVINIDGLSILTLAALNGLTDVCLKLIEKGLDVNAVDNDGNTPLMFAARAGHANTCIALIKSGADASIQNIVGNNALLLATQFSKEDACLALIELTKNLDAKVKGGWTALMIAVNDCGPNVILKLINKGANINAVNNDGNTAWMLAAALSDDRNSVLHSLLEKVTEQQIDIKNNLGESALLIAAKSGNTVNCQSIIDHGANIDVLDKNGQTGLILAAKNAHEDTCLTLIDNGADINKVDNNGRTVLMMAAENGMAEICERLIFEGANINLADKLGYTALKSAAACKNAAICITLLEADATCDEATLQMMSEINNPKLNKAIQAYIKSQADGSRKLPISHAYATDKTQSKSINKHKSTFEDTDNPKRKRIQ